MQHEKRHILFLSPHGEPIRTCRILSRFFFLTHATFNPLSLPSLGSFHFIPFYARARARARVCVCVCLFYLFLSLLIAIQSIFRPSCTAIRANAEYRVAARVKGLRKQATWELWDLKWDQRTQYWINHGAERNVSLN